MNKIYLRKNTKVYIMAPSNLFTGGPELLHQIGLSIKKNFKVDTFMYYLPENKHPIHKNFKKYNLKYKTNIEDKKENILIIPEYYSFVKYALKYKNLKKILWWLSIDNYYGYKFRVDYNKYLRSIIKIPFNIINNFNKFSNYFFGLLTLQDYLKFKYSFIDLNKLS